MDDTIKELVNERRRALHGAEAADSGRRPWGLALSGGGIRSATFCLGLLKSLAQHRQLLAFDLLSTVSGGGYIGSTLGRLCSRATTPDDVRAVEGAFAEVDKVRFGWWLRGNGRYLIPGGMRDTFFAVALFLRNLLGTHIEIAIAATLIGLVLAAVNLGAWGAAVAWIDLGNAAAPPRALQIATGLPTLWLLALVPWALSIVAACAYWSVRDRRAWRHLLGNLAMWCALGVAARWFQPVFEDRFGGPLWLAPAFIAFCAAWVVGLSWVMWRGRDRDAATLRNELTDALARMLRAVLVIALLGALDRLAWWLAAETRENRASYGAVLLVAAAALRGVLPTFFGSKREMPGVGKQFLMTLASVLGLVVAFCLAAWWIGVLYAGVLLPVFRPDVGLDFVRGWVWLGTIGVIVGTYALVTGPHFAFLNLSSLHMFYKARIVRGYLGAANAHRLGGDPLGDVSGLAPPEVPVGQVDAGDDLPQRDYAPHVQGGPVHLINVCINQTHDPKQKLFNRDRRSLPLTIGPRGWMQAVGGPWTRAQGDDALTLGAWAAISGAAFAPGLGRLTKRGIAALSVFAGLRLGYWWNSERAGLLQPGAAARVSKVLRKTRFLLYECFGAFPGSGSANWYLSDGGHFENTAAYALLRQEAELIVVADCGADPDYRFTDLEILIRRARIDLNADILFLKPCCDADWPYRGLFGSLNDLASPTSQACLALARVDYASGLRGHLVLVKPNVSATLPVDLVNFKAANPLFPQQPTTDQFFDEAQWESYFRLGSEIGQRIDGGLLARIVQGTQGLFEADDGQPVQAPAAPGTASAAVTMSRLQARVLKAGAVTASIGLGTAVTFGVAAWQGIDSWRTQVAEKRAAEGLAFKDLSERWSRLRVDAPPGEAPASLAAELLRTGELLCRQGADNFMANFKLSVSIVDDAKAACRLALAKAPATGEAPALSPNPACTRLLDANNGIDCLQPASAPACRPRYWARDYTGTVPSLENCMGSPSTVGTAVAASTPAPTTPYTAPVPPPPTAGAAPGASSIAPPTSGAAAPARPTAASRTACANATVYIQVFGPESLGVANGFRAPWQGLGANVPAVEDVLASSRKAGRSPPTGHARPTLLYGEGMQGCAEALKATAAAPDGPWDVKPLPPGLKAQPRTVEVWLPRPAASSRGS